MDKAIDIAVRSVHEQLAELFPGTKFVHEQKLHLSEIIDRQVSQYPNLENNRSTILGTSFLRPDGGFLSFTTSTGDKKFVLVSEVKRQGTNDKRIEEGLGKQAKGNAIERLGKNLIGIRVLFKNEGILPFVCFGSGCDFMEGSSIVDRVVTMNEFFPLNRIEIRKNHSPFEPAVMLFREEDWSSEEMAAIMLGIALEAIEYYKETGIIF